MKKYGAATALAVAILFGILAVVLANKWIISRAAGEKVAPFNTTPLAKVVVAAQDINIGSPLNEKNLTLADWPKSHVPNGAFESINDVQGRIAITKLVIGGPVLAAELAAPGSSAGLVALIRPGMRAMSIKVDEVIGVAGFILPNTYVDVISVQLQQGKGKKDKAETILKKIKVLAIAQETFTEDGKAKVVRTVTLELKQEQSEKLALLTNKGRVHLVLQNPTEQTAPKKVQTAVRKRLPVLKSRVRLPKRNPFDVEVIRGSDREKLRFKNFESSDRV